MAPKWKGPYRILAQKNPGVYKLKDIRTGKVTEQHIENLSEKYILARESEVPLAECPDARLPFPKDEVQEVKETVKPKRIPEGAVDDNWIDDSYVLDTPDTYDPNLLVRSATNEQNKKEPRRSKRISAQQNELELSSP